MRTAGSAFCGNRTPLKYNTPGNREFCEADSHSFPGEPVMSLYDTDFYAWANQQAALLRAGRMDVADIAHIAEEIESMGKLEKRELINRLAVLLVHLLKWRYQPGLHGTSWRLSVEEQRRQIRRHMADNPSLKPFLAEAIDEAFGDARIGAERESGLPRRTFPEICSWSYAQMLDDDFWPEGES
jgi:hypothetical protein